MTLPSDSETLQESYHPRVHFFVPLELFFGCVLNFNLLFCVLSFDDLPFFFL